MACSQFIPELMVGLLYTYWAPLGFVLAVTVLREAYDDFNRYKRMNILCKYFLVLNC